MAMKTVKLHGSPAYVAASRGAGSVAGAGMMPPKGPGPAANRKLAGANTEMPMGRAPSGSTPRGMKTYSGRLS